MGRVPGRRRVVGVLPPDYLGHPNNYIQANPVVTPPHIVPEWYFLPFYAILRAILGKLLGVIACSARSWSCSSCPGSIPPKWSAAYRPLFKRFYWVFVADFVLLSWRGSKPAKGHYVVADTNFTLYYFAYFLIVLPLIGMFEKPRPLPNSILELVTGVQKSGAAIKGVTPSSNRNV